LTALRIASVEAWPVQVLLTRPYAISYQDFDAAAMMLVRITAAGGGSGLGCGSSVPDITGETFKACREALAPGRLAWLAGQDVRDPAPLSRRLVSELSATPAVRAAVDIALHDLWAKAAGRLLADLLDRSHDALPTSIVQPAAQISFSPSTGHRAPHPCPAARDQLEPDAALRGHLELSWRGFLRRLASATCDPESLPSPHIGFLSAPRFTGRSATSGIRVLMPSLRVVVRTVGVPRGP
jgi:L-alanine-DL-glutamate epimerase-like enolase superfamily enzyme